MLFPAKRIPAKRSGETFRVSVFFKRMARENDIDFEDDVVYTSIYEREEGLLFEDEADFCSVLQASPEHVSELVLDGTAVLCPDLSLDKLSAAQLRELVLAGRQREQQLQKQCDELHESRKIWADNWVKEQRVLIEEAYAHAKATARRECEVCRERVLKAADLSRLLKSSDPGKAKQKTLDLQNQKLEQHVRMEHNVRKLTGWRPL